MSFDGVEERVAARIPAGDGLERVLWGVVALSLIGDVVTTVVGLHFGLAEANPIARGAVDGWGVVGLFALKAGAVGIGLCCRPLLEPAYRPIVPAGLAIPWTVATVANVYTISTVL